MVLSPKLSGVVAVTVGAWVMLAACGEGSAPATTAPAPPEAALAKPASAAASAAAKPSGAAPPEAAIGPAALALGWGEAINRGDAAAAAALFADDAVFVHSSMPCYLTSPCTGRAGILNRAQAELDVGIKQTLIGSATVAGNVVQMRQERTNPNIKAAGLERVVALTTATVQAARSSAG